MKGLPGILATLVVVAAVVGALALVSGSPDSDVSPSNGDGSENPPVANGDQPVPAASTTVPPWLVEVEDGIPEEESTTTIDPAGFDAEVRPGQSIQEAVDGLAEGARVLIGAGVHVGQQVKPKGGMTFVGEPGAVLDGQNTTEYAFVAFEGGADDVTISGLEITGYVQPYDTHGAIYGSKVSGWSIEDCEIHNNAYSGLNVGSNSSVRRCYIHHNGRIGLKASGTSFLIEGNEISHNNPDGLADPLWEAGGIKFVESDGGVIRNNFVHHNLGPGIWGDVDAVHSLIEDNVVENNTHAGIDYEISSRGVIRNNTIRFNGLQHGGGWMWGAGITIRGPSVQVYGNTLQGNQAGIALINTGRGSDYDPTDVAVWDNLIIDSGQNGAVRSDGPETIFDTSVFERNEYRYEDIEGKWWRWDDSEMTREQWLSTGNDQNGVFRAQ